MFSNKTCTDLTLKEQSHKEINNFWFDFEKASTIDLK